MKKQKKNSKSMKLLIGIIFLIGVGIMSYPLICNIHNKWINKKEQEAYQRQIEKNPPGQNEKALKKAIAYNKEHKFNNVIDVFDKKDKGADTSSVKYAEVLNPGGNGMMGYIEIPKIEMSLSIFHGITDEVLEKGVGHLPGTSLPVGGNGSHCVVAAHRGLPSAKLFTDLDRMENGDKFYIHVLDKVCAYRIDKIKTVLPKEMMKHLDIVSGKDLVTLVTCTPYGVNSHRLLVRGHRVPLDNHKQTNMFAKYIKYGIPILIIIVMLVIMYVWKKKDKKRKQKLKSEKK